MSSTNVLYAGQALVPGGKLVCTNGTSTFELIYQKDGRLVVYLFGLVVIPIWDSGAQNASPLMAVMQADGNFVLYDVKMNPYWASNTGGLGKPPNFKIVMQDDGKIVIYDSDGMPTYTSTPKTNTPGN